MTSFLEYMVTYRFNFVSDVAFFLCRRFSRETSVLKGVFSYFGVFFPYFLISDLCDHAVGYQNVFYAFQFCEF